MEEESIQELRRAVRRLYLDAPDPAIHTAMVVARARPSAPKSAAAAAEEEAKGPTAEAAAVGEVAGTPKEAGAVDRVIGTGADKRLTKVGIICRGTGTYSYSLHALRLDHCLRRTVFTRPSGVGL